jgi:hypothetical protein
MKISTLLFTVFVLIAVISLVTIWFYPSVQDFMASNSMWNGLEKFDNTFNATQIDSLDNLSNSPEKSVLVAIPYLDYTGDDLAKMKDFLDNGGTVLLMDDFGYGNTLLTYLGVPVRFSNKPLLDPLFCYKSQYLPLITDFAPGVKGSGVNVIMLNHATALINVTESETVAWSSADSFLDTNENGSLDPGEPKGPLPVAARLKIGKGNLAIVSDPSVIISAMAGRYDNYAFVRYLGNTATGKNIMVDRSHITQAPLDVSKTRLTNAHKVISNPYIIAGITAILFIVVSRYTLKKGEIIG